MILGRSRFPRFDHGRNKRKSFPIFEIENQDRLLHAWIKTGQGKSSFLENLWLQDVKAGHGCAFIEPHGQADQLLSLIPKRRRKDVVLFDPTDQDFSIGFNPLSNIPISRRPYVASTIVDCFKSIWGNSWGPQLEMFLYAGAAALLDFPTGTLLGLKFLMTSKNYRARVLSFVRDPAVRDFWETDLPNTCPKRSSANARFQRSTRSDNSSPIRRYEILSDSHNQNCHLGI